MLSCILPALTQARFAVGTGMAGCAGRIHQREHSLPRTALIILMTLTQRVSCETEVSISPEDPLILSETDLWPNFRESNQILRGGWAVVSPPGYQQDLVQLHTLQ